MVDNTLTGRPVGIINKKYAKFVSSISYIFWRKPVNKTFTTVPTLPPPRTTLSRRIPCLFKCERQQFKMSNITDKTSVRSPVT